MDWTARGRMAKTAIATQPESSMRVTATEAKNRFGSLCA